MRPNELGVSYHNTLKISKAPVPKHDLAPRPAARDYDADTDVVPVLSEKGLFVGLSVLIKRKICPSPLRPRETRGGHRFN